VVVPVPQPDETTQFFWEGVARHEVWIQRCRSCGRFQHHPQIVCRACLSDDVVPERVSGRGTLYSWTIAHQPFHPFYAERVPYTIATVELAEQPGLMFLSQVVDCPEADLRIGLPLEVVFEDLAPELTLPFFRPVDRRAG
jgi:uncharacterized protein